MQFKNPLILYALFLLLIPVVVHLFQLRRFKKTPFSNVAFLKSVVQHTRKSARLKKWLVLCTRLLAMSAFILAFAQPYIPQTDSATLERETVVFLDNSFSMQAKGSKGTLLNQAVQELLENQESDFMLVTYSGTYPQINVTRDQNTLLGITFSPTTLTAEELALKISNSFSDRPDTVKELLFISDFNGLDTTPIRSLKNLTQHWVQLKPALRDNSYISAIKLDGQGDNYFLQASINSTSNANKNVPISIYNRDKLVSRATASFSDSTTAEVEFRIPKQGQFLGRLHLDDASLSYDNDFYFNLDKQEPLQILSINGASDAYLKRLFNGEDYQYTSTTPDLLSYDKFSGKQVAVLNELKEIPTSLITTLQAFAQSGGKLILIPSSEAKTASYSSLLTTFGLPPYGEKVTTSQAITRINYDHPLFRNIFEERSVNFQYPKVSTFFPLKSGAALLSYADGSPFLLQGQNIFVFTAALDSANSNFQDSPLIVPTFGQMANSALSPPHPYYFLGDREVFDIKSDKTGDAVYSLRMGDNSFIPMQERRGGTVSISTQQGLEKAGIYQVVFKDSIVGHVAYNYKRDESRLNNVNPTISEGISLSDSIPGAINTVQEASSLTLFYKWFIIFAVLFLFSEMLILKFWK